MKQKKIDIPEPLIIDFCKKHNISRMALFGSVLDERFDKDSDIDVLVEFKEGFVPGFKFFSLQEELSQLLGREVDLNTPKFLSRYFRSDVISQAKTIYESK